MQQHRSGRDRRGGGRGVANRVVDVVVVAAPTTAVAISLAADVGFLVDADADVARLLPSHQSK